MKVDKVLTTSSGELIKEIRGKILSTQESLIDSALENDTDIYSKDWNSLEDVLVLLDDLEEYIEDNVK